jgi:hypothetical protein
VSCRLAKPFHFCVNLYIYIYNVNKVPVNGKFNEGRVSSFSNGLSDYMEVRPF